ncbi:proline-rich protein PRCC isoform 5-T5 [Pelodytes ibericus]
MNLPPPQSGPGMNLPPPQGGQGMNLPPPQGGQGMNLPPPQGGQGMNLPPPQGGQGMNLPPPQGGQGMNLPPPQGGQGMNLPPPQGGQGMNLPPPQGGQGMNLPPPQGGQGMNLPPPQGGQGMNLPPPQGGQGMNLPPPHGLTHPPPQSGPNMPLPHSTHGHSLPPQGNHGMNLPPPQASSGLNLSLPPPMGGHGMNMPPPQVGSGLSIPVPQGGQGLNMLPPQLNPISAVGAESRLSLPPPKAPGHGINLPPPTENPKPKKRTDPVKISVPELNMVGSDSEEDEPIKKKPAVQGSRDGFGLSALLPQPRNPSGADSKRQTLPYNFLKKASDTPNDTKPHKTATTSKPNLAPKLEVSHTPSPSAIKAAAKNAALQVTKQITQEEDDESDEELQGNFFSLSESSETPTLNTESFTYPLPTVSEDRSPVSEPIEPQNDAANAPLEFKTTVAQGSNQQWTAAAGEDLSSQPYSQYPEYSNSGAAYYQDYYNSGYYQESDPSPTALREPATSDSFMDDEAFKRLQGKRNRGREEINFVEIKGDDQLSGNQQWLTKSLTEEKNMKSFSKKKGEQPTGQQRRKHQITYLIHQAKERELELKNTWSDNKLSRRQTQAKYGF